MKSCISETHILNIEKLDLNDQTLVRASEDSDNKAGNEWLKNTDDLAKANEEIPQERYCVTEKRSNWLETNNQINKEVSTIDKAEIIINAPQEK
jgi:tRNA(Leu) C34 or U34 (ribose-2'-O)-methylase TrmL